MNKYFLSLILVLVSLQFAFAGLLKSKGIQVGVTSAGQDFQGETFPLAHTDLERRNGFILGGYLEWLNLPFFSVVTQLEYIQKGVGIKSIVTGQQGPEPLATRTDYSRLDYLSIPVAAKFRFDSNKFSIFSLAGLHYDYLMDYDSEFLKDVYDHFSNSTIGGLVGAGFELDMNYSFKPHVEVRYNFDLKNSLDYNTFEGKNNSIDLRLGFSF